MNQIVTATSGTNQEPWFEGKIIVKFTIVADGSVSRASIKTSSMGNPLLRTVSLVVSSVRSRNLKVVVVIVSTIHLQPNLIENLDGVLRTVLHLSLSQTAFKTNLNKENIKNKFTQLLSSLLPFVVCH